MWQTAETTEILIICVMAITVVMIIVIQQIQLRRHERLRRELSDILVSISENIGDINARLAAAGYPSRIVAPIDLQGRGLVSAMPAQR